MITQLTLEQVAQNMGFADSTQMILDLGYNSVMPACCSEGCEVEPDGKCEHGNPSILLKAGMI